MNNITPIGSHQLESVKILLNSFGLPVIDIETAPVQFFGIHDAEKIIAVGALEVYGVDALLRSVAVHNDFQNQGYGKQIVQYLENKAHQLGIERLFLLTTTAETFFKNLNYKPHLRNLCPKEIQSSREFSEICPSTAICLFKNLYT